MKSSLRILVAAVAIAACALLVPTRSSASVFVSVSFAPPPLLVYSQPPCPGPGYIWTPGYWAFDDEYGDYYWVPGTWVLAPYHGWYWTPGYWGWANHYYVWHPGYWGPFVGFYGGINYGYGYTGHGYHGGYWRDRVFYYNRSVNNVDVVHVHNTYHTTVVNNVTVNRVSYNGGDGGVRARPSRDEERAARERRTSRLALDSILSSGDGSAERPWSVLRISDEYDVLAAQDRRSTDQELVVDGDRRLDHHRCADGSEAWFDVTLLGVR